MLDQEDKISVTIKHVPLLLTLTVGPSPYDKDNIMSKKHTHEVNSNFG